MEPWEARLPFFYGWWLVGLTLFSLSVVVAPTFQGMGTFFVALQRHFGWSRTTISGVFALGRFEGAFLGPVEGLLTDRFGSRRMVLVGFLMLGAGFLLLSRVDDVVGLYASYLVIAAGSGLGGFLPMMAVLNNWFTRGRGTAIAIGAAGVHLAGLLVPVLAWAISTVEWQATALGVGLIIAGLAVPLSLMIQNRPEDVGLRPDGDGPPARGKREAADPRQPAGADLTLGEALRSRAFWIITGSQALSGMANITIAVHLVPALTDAGLALEVAGLVVATYTTVALVTQLVAGYLGDRVPKPPLMAVFILVQGLGILIIATPLATSLPGALAFAVLYGIGFGGRVPLFAAIRGDYFGRTSFATIVGFAHVPINLATVAAPVLTGYLFDVRGSYAVPFLGLAGLTALGSGLILLVQKPVKTPLA